MHSDIPVLAAKLKKEVYVIPDFPVKAFSQDEIG